MSRPVGLRVPRLSYPQSDALYRLSHVNAYLIVSPFGFTQVVNGPRHTSTSVPAVTARSLLAGGMIAEAPFIERERGTTAYLITELGRQARAAELAREQKRAKR